MEDVRFYQAIRIVVKTRTGKLARNWVYSYAVRVDRNAGRAF
jgi:hypothetical protein